MGRKRPTNFEYTHTTMDSTLIIVSLSLVGSGLSWWPSNVPKTLLRVLVMSLNCLASLTLFVLQLWKRLSKIEINEHGILRSTVPGRRRLILFADTGGRILANLPFQVSFICVTILEVMPFRLPRSKYLITLSTTGFSKCFWGVEGTRDLAFSTRLL